MVLYGQLIIGAPGSGKTTYCDGMQQYLRLLGRDCWVVNLDPANEVPSSVSDAEGASADNINTNEKSEENNHEGDGADGDNTNTQLPYETILDVCQDVISLDAVMTELQLGPNGGLIYCMEYIEHHLGQVMKSLKERLKSSPNAYLLFDLPGQIELTAHSSVVSRIAQRLVREFDLRLVCVQLVDAAICLTDVSKFIGAALVCTSSMMRLELPCVNLLSKMDLLQSSVGFSSLEMSTKQNDSDDESDCEYDDEFGTSPLPFNLEFFTQCHDLHRLVDYLDSSPMDFVANASNKEEIDPQFDYTEDEEYQSAQRRTRSSIFYRKYRKLHHELCDLVEDFGLLSFLPLSIQDAESVGRVVARVDKCNGYVFLKEYGGGSSFKSNTNFQDMFSSAMVADAEWSTGVLSDVQEKYLGHVMFHEKISELDRDKRKSKNKNSENITDKGANSPR
mmetsp:Transcript_12949/g.27483  ORF Transcript_12949/g.27483 Transcript_12949/m.27483 type:complete len:448 (-) Transcript_12949:31-1374(-)